MDAVAWLGRTFCQQYAAVTAIVYKKNFQEKAWLIVISHDHGEIAVACANVTQIDADEERDPPPKATPATFPFVEPFECRTWDDETPPPNLQSLFTRILKPTDVSERHLKALNIDLQPQCNVDDMLPLKPDGSSYTPSLTQKDEPQSTGSYADATKTDPRPARKRKDFDDRIAELQLENTMAYRAITRNFKDGIKPPRLAYLRVFWQGMESMSQYWDTTLDQHYSVDASNDGGEKKSPKRHKLDAEDDGARSDASDTWPVRTASQREAQETESHSQTTSDKTPDDIEKSSLASPPPSRPPRRTSMRYKGLRTNTGRAMPDQFRADAVRGLVEAAVWPFQCNVHPPRMMPLVHLHNLNVPVRQTVAVYRLPSDRARARQGGIVGPVFGVQVRSEVDFEGVGEGKARLDALREIGGLLQLAQERAREGRMEVKPGEGKWWTTVPRWGGGPGGEVANGDVVEMAGELLAATRGETGNTGREKDAAGRKRARKTPAMLWKELRCGSGYFDPKTDYAAIGKDPASEVDEVFLLSALNHHVALLKLTVHRAYTEYLRTAALPEPLPREAEWCRPRLQRSRWFDLFVEEDRVQAFCALWGVMAYLTREVGGDGKG